MLFGLMLLAAADSTVVRNIVVAPAETLRATIVGHGRPVVLIPGLLGSAYALRKVIPPLSAAGLQPIVIEPLGVGFSSRPGNSDYSFTAQARRVAAVLDTLGGAGCAPVLAHSHGVTIALRLALHRSDLVCGIVAENGGPTDTVASPSVKKAVKFAWLIKLFFGRGRIRSELRKGMLDTAGDTTWITREVIDNYTAGGAGDLGAVLRALKGMSRSVEPEQLAPLLSGLKIPIHALVGGAPKGSGIPPSQMAALKAGLPHLVVDTVPGAGLRIHEEQPAAVVQAVLDLVKHLGGNQAP